MTAELALRSVALLLAAGLVVRLAGRSPARRHLVWSLALAGLLLLPLATSLLPPWRVRVLPATPAVEGPRVAGAPAGAPAEGAADAVSPAAAAGDAAGPRAALRVHPLTALWLAGAAAFLAGLARDRIRLAAVRRRSAGAAPELAREVEGLARRVGVRRPVRVLESPGTDVPCTWGVARPVLAVPPGFLAWEPGRRRRILLHELAHVRRYDAAWGLVGEVATSLFWWNPLAWHAARSARAASEGAADAFVLGAGARPSDYAGDLLAVARSLARPAWARHLPGIGRGRLRHRIEAVLRPGSPPAPRRPATVAAGVLTVVLVAGAAAVLPVRAARPAPPPPEGSAPSPLGVATPPWPAHQVRWARGGEAGALFLEGEVDLARLVREGELPPSSGLLVWFHRGAGGSWRLFAVGRSGGAPWSAGRRDADRRPGPAREELRHRLMEIAPDWRDHPDTSIGALAALPELAGAPVLDSSGSVILGVPGSSRDPGTGVLQAGWYDGGERIGVFARGPLELEADGRSLARLPEDGWLAAFGWAPGSGRLRMVEALPDRGGRPALRYTENGVERPLDGAARAWLGRVLAALPGREPGATRVSWRG